MTPSIPVVTPKEVVQALLRGGFIIHRQTGSHLFLISSDSPFRIVCVPVHNKDLKIGTLKSILKQAGLNVAEFADLL